MPSESISAMPLDSTDDQIIISDNLLNSWLDEFPSGQPKRVKLTTQDAQTCILAIGATHPGQGIYVPQWILEQIGIPDGALYVTMELYVE